MKNIILIFTRNPELGKCKTRLAKTIGDENALSIYKLLLNKTILATSNLDCDKVVYYSEKISENDNWDPNIYQKEQQEGYDLGERMLKAFEQNFNKGYEKVIIIGSDLFELTQKHIEEAFLSLNSNDAVIGPAEDGGYYLLGLKDKKEMIFKNKKWGTSTVRKDTLDDLSNEHVHLLEVLNDIDIYEDCLKYDELKPFLK